MDKYTFQVANLTKGVCIIGSHTEEKAFKCEDEALKHFHSLCEKYKSGSYYYLCKWWKQ